MSDAASPSIRPRDVTGTTILLTGARGGIGRCIVAALLDAGAKRIIAADRQPAAWESPLVEPVALDITDRDQVTALAARLADQVDILINNAGQNRNAPFLQTGDPDDAVQEMQVNYFGTLNMVRAFGSAMRRRGDGVIVNMLTLGSHVCFPNMGSYCASKAALHSMTQSVRAELGYYGVDVIGIYPPAVDTRMSMQVPAAQKMQPEDVAAHVVSALRDGVEDVFIGAAAGLYERARREPKAVETMMKVRVAPATAAQMK